ncbi:MAG: phosphotransferase enzyme family protein, partial [Proteobacteria bacterium]|nr:phosphotransferase enzyme family protein [Pseudomonadota bacterium]
MEQLRKLYQATFGAEPEVIEPLGAHASKRTIYRLRGARGSVIGVYNTNVAQNRAFVGFTGHFKAAGLPVVEVYGVSPDAESYLVEDLGTTTLLDLHLQTRPTSEELTPEVLRLYRKAATWLPQFQVVAGKTLDFSLCHQSQVYDRRNMLWDMNYFLNSFVREYGVPFDASQLERDFEAFSLFLSQAGAETFMYRDFQARNIMVRGDSLYFIDYQEGRRGPLQYDVVSLVYQSKANLPPEARKAILQSYMDALSEVI